ncbi:MAG: hypothetical protein WD401_07540 [Thermomicrobiaceae bacterium]
MKRSILMLTTFLIAGLLLAACEISSTDDDDADDAAEETPVATETAPAEDPTEEPTSDPTEEESEDGEAESDDSTPEPDEEAGDEDNEQISLTPPGISLIAESGEQVGQVGPHFWIHEASGLAGEAEGGAFQLQEEPLVVQNGETVTIESDEEDYYPHTISAIVYPGEAEPEGQTVPLGSEPVDEIELDAEEGAWEVDLEADTYYIEIVTEWPTENDAFDRDKEATYRFWVTVE